MIKQNVYQSCESRRRRREKEQKDAQYSETGKVDRPELHGACSNRRCCARHGVPSFQRADCL